jgi:PAS domain S-box-containing protein
MKNTSVQKRAKPALSKEYQAVFEKTGKAMVIVEEDATISLANAEFEKLSGFTKKEIEGKKNWTEFVARDDRKRVKEYHLLRRTDPMLAPRSFEFRFLDRQEKVKNIILTIGQIPGTNKSMASLLDVTDRRKAEIAQNHSNGQEGGLQVHVKELEKANEELQTEVADLKRKVKELQESHDLHQSLVENVDFGINLIDADHNIVMINTAGTKQINKPVSELIGKKCYREFEKRDAVCPHCPGVQTIATGKRAEVEAEAVRDDGSRYNVRIQTFPVLGQDGTATGFIECVEDISKRKKMEMELRQSEERYRALAENIKLGINLIDLDHNIIMVNASMSKKFNRSLSGLIGKKCYQEFEQRDTVCPHCPGIQTMATGKPAEVETEGIRDDGSRFYVRLQSFPILGQDGIVTSFIEVAEDTTKRVKAEEAFHASEERFRMLAENIPFGISVMAPDRSFEYINPQFTKIFGYTIEDIPDKDTWFEKAYPDEEYRKKVSSQWTKDVKEKVEVGEENQRIFTVRCKDGKYKIIDFRTVYFKDGKKYLIYDDITDRAKAEEALRESEGRYRTLAENVNFGLNLIDADYNIVMVNAALSKRLKKTASELIGKKCFREFEQRDAMCPHCPGIQAMDTGKSAEVETERVRDDQRRLYMRLKAFPIIGQDGKATGFIEVIEDITKRKLIEETLKQSEERYRALVENVHLGINLIDADHTILSVNDGQSSHFGKPRSETIGKKCYQEFEKRDAVCPHCPGIQTLATGQPAEAETEGVRDDGSRFNVRLQTFPLLGQDGTVTSFIEVVEDITEHKQMEEELRQTENRFRKLVETMKVGLTSIDEKGALTYANEQFCKTLGYSMDEVIGRPTVDFYYDEETRKAQEEVFAKRKEGMRDPAPYEIVWRTKDGRKVYTILSPTPSFDADGRYIGSSAIQTDITERKRMEEKLRQSEERFRTLVETMKVGLSAIDKKGIITYANERLSEMWGYPMDEVIGRCTLDFLDEDNLKIAKEQLAKRSEGDRGSYELTWTRKDGQKIHTILSPTPRYDADGRFTGSFAIITDITERKRMEERLKRYAAELEQSNEEVKNFAYIVSHDLRVPLVNLKGYTSELHSALEVIGPTMETALPHLNEDKRSAVAMALHEDVPEALEFITNSVSRMDSFINSVLILSRLGRRELKPEPIDMNALVRTSLETLSHQIQERGTTVTIGSLPQVVADRTAMEQIMGNILGNAVKYLDSERPGQIDVTAQTNNSEQLFRIRDNGRGIAQEDMHKVFAPFRRAGKEDTQGEGMGLAYVQTLVRRHKGRIWCESELGKGTTFTFTISQR